MRRFGHIAHSGPVGAAEVNQPALKPAAVVVGQRTCNIRHDFIRFEPQGQVQFRPMHHESERFFSDKIKMLIADSLTQMARLSIAIKREIVIEQ